MYNRIIVAIVLIIVLFCFSAVAPTSTLNAGNNGQQLFFYVSGSNAKMSWLYVKGKNQNGSSVTWSRAFSPATTSYSLSNWWWKGPTDVQYRMSDGKVGYCTFIVPTVGRDWIAVGVNRQPGNSCWVN